MHPEMKKIAHALGSIYFAIGLLVLTAILVALGTFVESKFSSHKQASDWVYRNPLFLLILWGYFVNILFAWLNRFPLKMRHIPFTVAHIGLLMLIAGVILKYTYGEQGYLLIKEGREIDHAFYSDSPAITIEGRDKSFKALNLTDVKIAAYYPHMGVQNELWFKRGGVALFGSPFITNDKIHKHSSGFFTYATERNVKELKETFEKPLLLFLKQPNGKETLIAVNEGGDIETGEFEPSEIKEIFAYDGGFSGYGIAFKFFGNEIETPITARFFKEKMPDKKEDYRPLLVLEDAGVKTPLHYKNPLPTAINDHLYRFEDFRFKLPFKVRLRQARTTYYPNTNQPFSYEADIKIGKKWITLSMNKVYESDEGYRFYLSNISPQDPGEVKTVQLTLNRDPFKGWLTYPGAIILTFGILLLFTKPDRWLAFLSRKKQ